ncbi:2TM domain-containing protein [Clostridium cavendishii DSM 21758]|uniref:2TM domain-containing protein n=1 Tax=Clostridium cavendishii DSM 21758 TaxID=1121302 RepID=A0A1M6TWG6_9CLOT|nr:2TM domain-containing protein [Clostridium cavendishii]SHK61279.1 2TM domain-containing protein [Clostridium cavendishii DSM 21758]
MGRHRNDDLFVNKDMNDNDIYSLAVKRIMAKRKFLVHLAVYVAVNLMLWTMYIIDGNEHAWPMWVTFGWGIAIISHGIELFTTANSSSISKEIEHIKTEYDMLNK